jgi:hypothetical protein
MAVTIVYTTERQKMIVEEYKEGFQYTLLSPEHVPGLCDACARK